MNILVVGDAHVDDTQRLDRFTLCNRFIHKYRPDAVVLIGDFLSLNCLSAWDQNKRKAMEGKRYAKELKAGNDALNMMQEGTSALDISWVYLEGNHEDRLTRYVNIDPTFEGAVGIEKDLSLKDRGFSWVPYKTVLNIRGINFCHVPLSGNGRAISNPNVCQKALRLFAGSVVFGHTHTLDVACEHRHGSKHLAQALSVGCFFEHVDEYALGAKTDYWRGLVLLDAYKPERFDIHTYSLGNLRRELK